MSWRQTQHARKQRSLVVSLAVCGLLHGTFIWTVRGTLPFPTLGVAILGGMAEAAIFALVSARIWASADFN